MSKPHTHAVLVVDDDDDARNGLVLFCDALGVAACGAESAEDALRRLRDGLRPCGMIVDVGMPEIDGWMLVERMRRDPDLAAMPVVLLSGYQCDAARVAALGIAKAFIKPAEPAVVVAAVTACCGEPGTAATKRGTFCDVASR